MLSRELVMVETVGSAALYLLLLSVGFDEVSYSVSIDLKCLILLV